MSDDGRVPIWHKMWRLLTSIFSLINNFSDCVVLLLGLSDNKMHNNQWKPTWFSFI